MKLSYRAFKLWLDFPGSAKDLADTLSQLGFPNDGIEHWGEGLDQVVIGKILEKKPHPEADRLSLLQVDIGTQVLPIVCGAQNMIAGNFVALAPVGAKIPGKDGAGLTMREAKIRGQVSLGMCCSEVELKLAPESDGILLLAPEKITPELLGKKVSEVFDFEDWIIDVDITPNRPDAMSLRGLAREVGAKLGLKLKNQRSFSFKNPITAVNPSIESLVDTSAFSACLVHNVVTKPSPPSLIHFLRSFGGRSISNLVDITNRVLFELGHPIHFFDADKVDASTIAARRARAGETLELLNEQKIELHPDDLIIADLSGPLSLAGIMGGARTAISNSTKNILIEVACFNPALIHAAAKRHKLASESSARFERGLTPYRIDEVMERTLGLLKEYSEFDSAAGTKVFDRKLQPKQVAWDRARVERKIGNLSKSDDEIHEMLRRLEYGLEPRGSSVIVTFPWYRADGEYLEDVMEDIARLIGYDQLEVKRLESVESIMPLKDVGATFQVADALVADFSAQGFVETIHMSFADRVLETRCGYPESEASIELQNPMHSERAHLRRAILPQLLERAKINVFNGEEEIRLVETGPVFNWTKKSAYDHSAVSERFSIAVIWIYRLQAEKQLWKTTTDPFYEFKGIVEKIHRRYSLVNPETPPAALFHPAKTFSLGGTNRGGEIHPAMVKDFDISGRVFGAEWIFTEAFSKRARYHKPPEFQPIDLDASMVVSKDLQCADLLKSFAKVKIPILEDVRVYDIFESNDLGDKKKSMTFAMRYRSLDRTLTLEEAKEAHQRLVRAAIESLGADKIALR